MTIQPAAIIDVATQDRLDTEMGLLGFLLSHGDPVAYRAAAAIVGPEQFQDHFNARLFARLGEGIAAGLVQFQLTAWIIGQFRDDKTLAELGMPASALVARYAANAFPRIAIEGAARQIRHDWLNDKLKAAVEAGDTSTAEASAAEMERLSRAHLEKDEGLKPIGQLADQVLERLADLYQNGALQQDFAHAGSAELGRIIGGWRRGRYYVIAGRPGMGKSTTALSWLIRTAGKGHGVLFFSLEMTAEELNEISLCDVAWTREARIEYRDITSSATSTDGLEWKYEALRNAASKIATIPFTIIDRGGLTIADIRSQALLHAQKLEAEGKRLEVIAIDHLNLIRASDRYGGNKAAETEEISSALKQLAKELKCAVVCLVQLNRGVEGREDKRPGLSDLRWSGAIEQDADVVMFVYREAYYLSKQMDDTADELERQDRLREVANKLELIIAKHRGGPTLSRDFYCDMGCGVIRDMDPRA